MPAVNHLIASGSHTRPVSTAQHRLPAAAKSGAGPGIWRYELPFIPFSKREYSAIGAWDQQTLCQCRVLHNRAVLVAVGQSKARCVRRRLRVGAQRTVSIL
eukprot:219130-Rhodomonas_salina.2